jgi:transposase
MARITELCDETRALFRDTSDVRLRERLHACLLSRDGYSRNDIAEILYRDVEEVRGWLARYRDGGLSALMETAPPAPAEQPSSESPESSTPELQSQPESPQSADPAPPSSELGQRLEVFLGLSPRVYGRRTDVWTTRALAEVLERSLARPVSPDEVRAALESDGRATLQSRSDFLETRRLNRAKLRADTTVDAAPPALEGQAASPTPPEQEASPTTASQHPEGPPAEQPSAAFEQPSEAFEQASEALAPSGLDALAALGGGKGEQRS